MIEYSDVTIRCKECGKDFVFSEDEQAFYKTKGFSTPQRCKQCRSRQRQSASPKVCAECGSSFVEDAPVFCAACVINRRLEAAPVEVAAQPECELSTQVTENRKSVEEAVNRAVLAEAAETKASELLLQKARELCETRASLDLANAQLEKSAHYTASLEKVILALENLQKRINLLETNQKTMVELLYELSKKTNVASRSSLLETLRGFFRTHNYPASSS